MENISMSWLCAIEALPTSSNNGFVCVGQERSTHGALFHARARLGVHRASSAPSEDTYANNSILYYSKIVFIVVFNIFNYNMFLFQWIPSTFHKLTILYFTFLILIY